MRRLVFIALLASWVQTALSQSLSAPSLQTSAAASFEKGKAIERVVCAQHPDQSYALYLPSNYSPDRKWPIVYSFDPAARGKVPLELEKDAAERYGYILAASNNSKNGPWKAEFEAADAMFHDTHARLAIDDQATYFAGFSGGARVASQLALACKCATGVLLSGAGFPSGVTIPRDAPFEVFAAVGTFDFNYPEVVSLQEKLDQAGYPHWLFVFEGLHEWAPEAAMEEGLAWFRAEAMRTKRNPQDKGFLAAQFSQAVVRADASEKAGSILNAWRGYRQIIATFDGLADVAPIRAKADRLGNERSFRDAVKQERKDFEEQGRLSTEVLANLSSPREQADSPTDLPGATEARVAELRTQAEEEKRPERARVYQRALAGVFVGSMETGIGDLGSHNYPGAVRAFTYATVATPDSEWAWRNLAVAQAQNGSRKEALAALKRARDISRDKAAFAEWARSETAFAPWRATAEYQALLDPDGSGAR